ncbi:DUF3598 family protein [Gloeocapsa sp. PCC 73106]|uniref:DUF3598 family protein n=1 Tax=Gloeocapsa sp. PCC 73106 TaxID=102232 RepID=UPI0002ACC307|nr:DUF3598 family protein [Gloeocapsa sp. PCC 73106]ELR96537.1 protein of unknown function (DUF3598) [Gloeocapsa sp. PCC 73106]
MSTQWQYFLKNLGQWHGSFTRMSTEGEIINDTPTVVLLEGRENNQAVHQVVRYLPPNETPRETVVNYTSLSRSIVFFPDGAFSQGSMFWSLWSQSGAEFGLIKGDRRLRMVQLFNQGEKLDFLTLIREKLPQSNTPERPQLTVEQLLGTWQGENMTIYPDFSSSQSQTSELNLVYQGDRLTQRLNFGQNSITSTATVNGHQIDFSDSPVPVRVLLLPDGASATFPLAIQQERPFFLEMGWLIEPSLRQRLIRSYNSKGEWESTTLVTEKKISVR